MNKPKILKENVIALRNAWTKLSETWSENEDPIINQILEHDYPWDNCFSELRCDVVAWADTIEHKLGKLESDIDTQRLFEEFIKRKRIVSIDDDRVCLYQCEPEFGLNAIHHVWIYGNDIVIGIRNNGLFNYVENNKEYDSHTLINLEKMAFDFALKEGFLDELKQTVLIESILVDTPKEFSKEEKSEQKVKESSAYAEMFKDIRNWHRLWEAFEEKASPIQPLTGNDFLNTLKDKYRVDFNTEFKGPKSVE